MSEKHVTCGSELVERLLQQLICDDEQADIEAHLDVCDDCCRELELAVGSDDACVAMRDSLHSESPCLSNADSLEPALSGDDPSFSIDTVLQLLAPTDDDRMIGRLGSYEVVGVIGSGGMGVVLKAFDPALNRYVAIKILSPHLGNSGAARQRFSREAQAAAAVVHDNVIEIHGVADTNGLPYLVMPYVSGPSLQKRLDREGPLSLVEILRIAKQAAAGLAAAHAQGLVHRDVKPANIMLADGVERVKLTDFGLARTVDDASLTKTGVIAGTPQFMSPEQARGEAVDATSDLFGLGSVLYAMCTGRPPFRAETSYGILHRITDTQPRPIREINPDVPNWLCAIIAKLMSKDSKDRFESASKVAELLEDCLAHVQQPATMPLPKCIERLVVAKPTKLPGVQGLTEAPTTFVAARSMRTIAAVAFVVAFIVAGFVIVLELNKGSLTIESEIDDIPIRITHGNKVVERLMVTRDGASIRIAAGQYAVQIEGRQYGVTIDNSTVSLLRGGRQTVRIIREDVHPASTAMGTGKELSPKSDDPFKSETKSALVLTNSDRTSSNAPVVNRPPPISLLPFPQIARPSVWSESRYNAYLLSQGAFQSALKLDTRAAIRLSSMYEVAEEEERIADKADIKSEEEWGQLVADMQNMLTDGQRLRSVELQRQQMGFGIFTTASTQIHDKLALTAKQRKQIDELIAHYERTIAQLDHYVPEVVLPDWPIRRPDVLTGMRIAAAKKTWLRYWFDRQIDRMILDEMNLQQQNALADLYGVPAVEMLPPYERFGSRFIDHVVEPMLPVRYQPNLIYLHPPTDDEVIKEWLVTQRFEKGKEPSRDTVYIVKDKLVDYAVDSQPGEKKHPGQWHIGIYSCTVYRSDVVEPVAVIYKDVARFYPTITSKNDSRPKLGSLSGTGQVGHSPHAVTQVGGPISELERNKDPQVSAQLSVQYPKGATLAMVGGEKDTVLKIPGRLPAMSGGTLRLNLREIPNHKGVQLTTSIELASVTKQTKPYLDHSAIPLTISGTDIEHAVSGKVVTTVVYLPNAEDGELALAGVESLVTERLGPGINPIREAQRRGAIIAVLRLGNRVEARPSEEDM